MLFDREIIKDILAESAGPDILILLGSRQVGKTSLLKIIADRLKAENRDYLFLDLDLERNLGYFSNYESVLAYIEFKGYDPVKDSLVLLLDEFHRAEGAGKTLKNLYDHHPNIKIIATGSSSLEIAGTISESMSGRKFVFRVFPLSFREFLVFKERNDLTAHFDRYRPGDAFPSPLYGEYQSLVAEKLVFGSFPEVVLEKNRERKGRKIDDILNSYLRKDIKEQLGIKDTVQYKRVLEYIGITIAGLLNTNGIAKELGTYHRKVSDVIDMAVETFIVDRVRPFAKNRKKEIVRNPKMYFEDTGMRNFLVKNMNPDLTLRPDTGALVENLVYNELVNAGDVYTEVKFWRTKNDTEIDFLLVKNRQVLPIEVKSGSYAKVPKSLLLFCQKEKISRAVIVTRDVSKIETKDGIDFYFVPFIFSSKIPAMI